MDKTYKRRGATSVSRPGDATDRATLQIARRVAATIGADFFRTIAQHLAKALKADCVLIGEFVGGQVERVKTLGALLDGQPATFEYELAGSASAQIALGRELACRADAQSRYPSDALLPNIQAQACTAVPLLTKEGVPVGLMMALYRHPIASVRNITTMLDIFAPRAAAELCRKREEDSLRESDQRHRAFVARNADAMWRVEFEQPIDITLPEQEQLDRMYRYGYLAECNDALARLVDEDKAERLIGSRLDDIAPLSDPSIREANLQAIRAGYEFNITETSPTGKFGIKRHLLRSQWGIVEDGKLERMWGVSRDITDLKLTRRALTASEQRMTSLMESVRMIVVIVDNNGVVTYCNEYFFRFTGWKTKDVVGRRWLDLLIPEDYREKLRSLLAEPRENEDVPLHFECVLMGPGKRRWQFDWDRLVLRDKDGKAAAWANLGRDVTEQRELEEHFRHSQRLASIGRVVGSVAHDFNNLLTIILGYSASLIERRDASDPDYDALEAISKAAGKGTDLIHGLMAFSRRQVLRPEVVNINNLVTEAEQMMERLIGAGIRLTIRCDPALGRVRVDPGSLHQVLLNLAVNARDAMPNGGELSIVTSGADIRPNGPFAGKVPPGEYIQVTVSDTGTGMTEETRQHLFEPFFTTKEPGKGTGLGLASVYGIIQQSGGRIVVETAEGVGTTFRIFLPKADALAIAPAREQDAVTPLVGGTETILLVDRRDDVRQAVALVLRELGYTVLESDGLNGALELARGLGRTIHLLLADAASAEVGGLRLANLVQPHQAGMKVLLMSAGVTLGALAKELSERGFGYVQKPFTRDAIARNVRQILDQA